MSTLTPTPARSTGKVLGPALWTVQVLLALFFIYAGGTKLATPVDVLSQSIPWTAQHPSLVLLTGWVDLLGGLGILLPALLRIQPKLTPLAALGLVVLQVAALAFHAVRAEMAVVPMNVVLIGLAAFVLWGRTRALPIAAR